MMVERKVFSMEMRNNVYEKTKGKCALCGKFVRFDLFTIDHIIPCGLYKADRLTSYFDEIMENTKFIRWYFGHYHDDRVILGKFVMLYHSFQRVV